MSNNAIQLTKKLIKRKLIPVSINSIEYGEYRKLKNQYNRINGLRNLQKLLIASKRPKK